MIGTRYYAAAFVVAATAAPTAQSCDTSSQSSSGQTTQAGTVQVVNPAQNTSTIQVSGGEQVVDSQQVEPGTINIQLQPGTYHIRLIADGLDCSADVTVQPDQIVAANMHC